jgi:hypothetical protein
MSVADENPREADPGILTTLLAALSGGSGLGDLEPQRALAVARHHRLSALLATAPGLAAAGALGAAFRKDRVLTAARGLMLEQAAERCLRAFADAGLRVAVLKGLAYDALYPPGTRPTSDVDLLVPDASRRAAFAVMDSLGFEPRAAAPGFDEADYHEVAWRRQGIEVDLHMALAPLVRCAVDYDELWGAVVTREIGAARAGALHPRHAGVFHALHMAIDHFDVPALYLLDFSRLLPTADELARAETTARSWRCWRPFATATALTAAFVPDWPAARAPRPTPPFARAVVARYGTMQRLPRGQQLVRKLRHFDSGRDALGYLLVQGRRNVRELYERRVRGRSARERLALGG